MTLPRPVLIALLGLALCAAAFLATRSANDTGNAVTSTPPTPAPTPAAKPAKPATTAKKPSTHKASPAPAKPAEPADKQATAQKPATPAKPASPSSEVEKVLAVTKALGRGDVVVFFFTRPGPADDTGTRQAVRSVSHEKGVSVFTAGLHELETYRPVLSGAGVSQVPAIVVVRAGKKARLLQGFVDAATLRQTVADARR